MALQSTVCFLIIRLLLLVNHQTQLERYKSPRTSETTEFSVNIYFDFETVVEFRLELGEGIQKLSCG